MTIEQQIEAFKAAGGEIKKCPTVASAKTQARVYNGYNERQELRKHNSDKTAKANAKYREKIGQMSF